MPLLIFLLVVGVFVALIAVANRGREKLNQSWGAVARHFGLTLTPAIRGKLPRLEGMVDGYPLTIDMQKKGGGQYQSIATRFRLGVPTLNLGLELKEEGFLSNVSKAFGATDIEIGDAAFDQKLLIKGRNAAAVREFLTPERRARILKFVRTHRGTVINDQGISWSMPGQITDASNLMATVGELLAMGSSLASPTAGPALPAALGIAAGLAAGAGTTAGVVAEAAPEPEPDPVPEPELVPESETVAAAEKPPVMDEPAILAAPVPESPAGISAAEFCTAVFATGTLSYAAAQIFRKEFEGQQVHWSGTLKSTVPYRFDFVFGAGGGIKAQVAMHKLEGALLGDGQVTAVIQLPADTGGLSEKIGEQVSFTGTLTKVDGLQRLIFVSDARLGS